MAAERCCRLRAASRSRRRRTPNRVTAPHESSRTPLLPLSARLCIRDLLRRTVVAVALCVAFVGSADLGLGGAAGIISEAAERHAILVRNDVMQERLGALQGQTLDGLARLARVLKEKRANSEKTTDTDESASLQQRNSTG
jgi:hypothetical protein